MPQLTFISENITVDVSEKESLLDAAIKAGVFIEASCGGRGLCGKCRVQILKGDVTPPDEQEQGKLTDRDLENGIRLACKTFPLTDVTLQSLAEKKEGTAGSKTKVVLPENFHSDKVKDGDKELFGIAFDIGTTTLVGMLWNLSKGVLVKAAARTNPQRQFGADVISRIVYAGESPENCKNLQQLVIGSMNEVTEELCSVINLDPAELSFITVDGNTTMSHLFMGVDPSPLAQAPYDAVFLGPLDVRAQEVGLLAGESTKILLLPNIASHVGSDITAVILAADLPNRENPTLAVDIGTNGEMVLAHNGKMLTCSTAAGPAFEGASIYQGMRAAPGAIDGARFEDGIFKVTTIDNAPAKGICGSGLMDVTAAMIDAEVIDETGRLIEKEDAQAEGFSEDLVSRLFKDERGTGFILAKNEDGSEVVLLQKDIREIQLAKSAMFTGMEILMSRMGIKAKDLDKVLLAGAFGSYIRKESALKIGLVPQIDPERIVSIGNGAGLGVSMTLLSEESRRLAEKYARETEHIELANDPEFQDAFVDNLSFE